MCIQLYELCSKGPNFCGTVFRLDAYGPLICKTGCIFSPNDPFEMCDHSVKWVKLDVLSKYCAICNTRSTPSVTSGSSTMGAESLMPSTTTFRAPTPSPTLKPESSEHIRTTCIATLTDTPSLSGMELANVPSTVLLTPSKFHTLRVDSFRKNVLPALTPIISYTLDVAVSSAALSIPSSLPSLLPEAKSQLNLNKLDGHLSRVALWAEKCLVASRNLRSEQSKANEMKAVLNGMWASASGRAFDMVSKGEEMSGKVAEEGADKLSELEGHRSDGGRMENEKEMRDMVKQVLVQEERVEEAWEGLRRCVKWEEKEKVKGSMAEDERGKKRRVAT